MDITYITMARGFVYLCLFSAALMAPADPWSGVLRRTLEVLWLVTAPDIFYRSGSQFTARSSPVARHKTCHQHDAACGMSSSNGCAQCQYGVYLRLTSVTEPAFIGRPGFLQRRAHSSLTHHPISLLRVAAPPLGSLTPADVPLIDAICSDNRPIVTGN